MRLLSVTVWEEIANSDEETRASVNMAKMDCTESDSVCTRQKVNGYPTLKLYHNGDEVSWDWFRFGLGLKGNRSTQHGSTA